MHTKLSVSSEVRRTDTDRGKSSWHHWSGNCCPLLRYQKFHRGRGRGSCPVLVSSGCNGGAVADDVSKATCIYTPLLKGTLAMCITFTAATPACLPSLQVMGSTLHEISCTINSEPVKCTRAQHRPVNNHRLTNNRSCTCKLHTHWVFLVLWSM